MVCLEFRRVLSLSVPLEVRSSPAPDQFTVPLLLNVPGAKAEKLAALSVAVAPELTLNALMSRLASPKVAAAPLPSVTDPLPCSVPPDNVSIDPPPMVEAAVR